MNSNRVGVVGSALMGTGIATKFALAGVSTVVIESDTTRITKIPLLVDDMLAELKASGLITAMQCEAVQKRISTSTDLTAVAAARIVIEAIFASNTSGLLPDALCKNMSNRGRFLIAHFWNPPHMIPLVEVVPGSWTTPSTVEKTVALLNGIAAEPVVLKVRFLGSSVINCNLRCCVKPCLSYKAARQMPRP